jgi:hypothetical protein
MMVGLKRDLREAGEGLIYPQEVRIKHFSSSMSSDMRVNVNRHTEWRKSFAVIDMPNARLPLASS